jgi:site-specific DNA recombinase
MRGLRVHDPSRHARRDLSIGSATVTEGQWEPLVDRRRFYMVQKFLSAPGRQTNGSRPGRAVHEFSMIVKCGLCGGPLSARIRKDAGRHEWQYACHWRNCVRVNKDELDSFATDAILAALRSDQLYAALAPTDIDHEQELAAVRDKLADLRAQHDELAAAVAAGKLSAMLAAKAEPPILDGIAREEKREQELLTPNVLASLITPGEDVAQRWASAAVSTKREVARLLLSADVLGELRLLRSPSRGHRCPIEQRLQWWKP